MRYTAGKALPDPEKQIDTVNMAAVYGEEYEEFAIQCGYTAPERTTELLNIDTSEAEDSSLRDFTEYIYLKDSTGNVPVKEQNITGAEFCSGINEEAFTPLCWMDADHDYSFHWDDVMERWKLVA